MKEPGKTPPLARLAEGDLCLGCKAYAFPKRPFGK